jgi:tyrosinase
MEELNLSPSQFSRRVFIKGMGWITVGLLAGLNFGDCESCLEQISKRPVRRRLRTGSWEVDAAINTYRNAVRLMKNRSLANIADTRGWSAQAGIHGTRTGGFRFCQHRTSHFFSWHRAYLLWLERICQRLTGDKYFGLPYWNWNQNPGIHPAFLDTSSVLYMPRTRTTMAGQPEVSTSTLNLIFSDTNFFTFSSQLEGTPHNRVHTYIGGDFATAGSAMDPIFWMHHCMIDYCWAKWNMEMGNNNPNSSTWLDTRWTHFYDENGHPVATTARETTTFPLLYYRYETSAVGSNMAAFDVYDADKADFKKLEQRIRKGADIRFNIRHRILLADTALVSIAQPFTAHSSAEVSDFSRIIHNDRSKETVFASIDYASLPPAGDFFVRVFVNLPAADRHTPITDPHYAGSFAFFGTDTGQHDHHGGHEQHQPGFLVNITPTLQQLRRNGELKANSEISIRLVAVPNGEQFEKPDALLRLTKVELIVTPVLIPDKEID